MSKIPCEIIKDLLPSYIDELTSDVTNREVESHVAECEQCRKTLEEMRTPDIEIPEKEVREIDFLKVTKKKQRKNIICCIVIVAVIAVVVFGAWNNFSGQYVNTDYLAYNLEVSGTELSIAVHTTSDQGIQKLEIHEESGVVDIAVRCVQKSLFYKSASESVFQASEEIHQVKIGNRIVWSDGVEISPLTSSLFAVYNPYIGDMSANGEIARVLNMTAYTGGFKNELQTAREPYSWKLISEKDFSSKRQAGFEDRLKKYAYIFLAEIGNLSEVIFEYSLDGEKQTLSVTAEEASAFAGGDIKEVGKNIVQLEALVAKTGFSNVVLGGDAVESNSQGDVDGSGNTEKVLGFTVINFAEDEICGMSIGVDCGNQVARQAMGSANGEVLQKGLNVEFQLIPEDFSGEIENGTRANIQVNVTDSAGIVHEVQTALPAELCWGQEYKMSLSGNSRDGYFLEIM